MAEGRRGAVARRVVVSLVGLVALPQAEPDSTRAIPNAVALDQRVATAPPEMNRVLRQAGRTPESLELVVVHVPPGRGVRVDPPGVAVGDERPALLGHLEAGAPHDAVVHREPGAALVDLDRLLPRIDDPHVVHDRPRHHPVGLPDDVNGMPHRPLHGQVRDHDVAGGHEERLLRHEPPVDHHGIPIPRRPANSDPIRVNPHAVHRVAARHDVLAVGQHERRPRLSGGDHVPQCIRVGRSDLDHRPGRSRQRRTRQPGRPGTPGVVGTVAARIVGTVAPGVVGTVAPGVVGTVAPGIVGTVRVRVVAAVGARVAAVGCGRIGVRVGRVAVARSAVLRIRHLRRIGDVIHRLRRRITRRPGGRTTGRLGRASGQQDQGAQKRGRSHPAKLSGSRAKPQSTPRRHDDGGAQPRPRERRPGGQSTLAIQDRTRRGAPAGGTNAIQDRTRRRSACRRPPSGGRQRRTGAGALPGGQSLIVLRRDAVASQTPRRG